MNTVVPPGTRVRVWDLPTRVFHWSLVVSLIASVLSAKIGGDLIAWHFRFGYAVLALLLFRVVWGFVGGHYARFASFPPSIARALAYLRNGRPDTPGHNPVGGFSVYLLLATLLFQAVSGLFANDDIMWDGPLRHLVSDDMSELVSQWHRANEVVIYALIALHLAAIAFHTLVKKQKLAPAMISGDKLVSEPDAPSARDTAATRLLALGVFTAIAAAVAAIVNL